MFAAGEAAFLIDGDWRVRDFLTNQETGEALISRYAQEADFDLIPFPAIPDEKNPGLISAVLGTGFGISKAVAPGSAKEKAAKKLIEYLYSKKVMTKRLEVEEFVPSNKCIRSDKLEPLMAKRVKFNESVPMIGLIIDAFIDGDNAPVVEALQNGMQEMCLGTKTAREVAEDMQAMVVIDRSKK